MSTFENWLSRAAGNTQEHMIHATELGDKGEALLDEGRLDAIVKVLAKRNEMVCKNCAHWVGRGAGGECTAVPISTTLMTRPDFYCKSWKGKE